MIRNRLNDELRDFARGLSPTQIERGLVSDVYVAVTHVLGADRCTQIGSYPRFTAITPVHDLDVIVCLGEWNGAPRDVDLVMGQVMTDLRLRFKNPTVYRDEISIQSHSITIKFLDDKDEEKFAVDIVPAYAIGKNSYGDVVYMVPQAMGKRRRLRNSLWNPADESSWIKSDPRGYINLAREVGENPDFRKAVKLVKFWKNSIRAVDETLKLKSFHLEQVVLRQFQEKPDQDVFGAIFDFFCDLPQTVLVPNQIKDRAQPGKYIDDYIAGLSKNQRELVLSMRDAVLIGLEKIKNEVSVERLLTARCADRDKDDEFLFEKKIPMLYDGDMRSVEITCEVEELGNRAMRRLRSKEKVSLQRELTFRNKYDDFSGTYWWKVKNSRGLPMEERRGELTEGHTRNDPEYTEYSGRHYVECYRVVGGVCIDADRFDVIIAEDGGLSFGD